MVKQYAIGISYPFRRADGQFPKMEYGANAVDSDLVMLFRTPLRSRVMRPKVGTDAESQVFEPNVSFLEIQLETSIKRTIVLNEPRVKILNYEHERDGTKIKTDIRYSVLGQPRDIALEFDKEF